MNDFAMHEQSSAKSVILFRAFTVMHMYLFNKQFFCKQIQSAYVEPGWQRNATDTSTIEKHVCIFRKFYSWNFNRFSDLCAVEGILKKGRGGMGKRRYTWKEYVSHGVVLGVKHTELVCAVKK